MMSWDVRGAKPEVKISMNARELRLGLLAGSPEWLGEVDKTRLPYNINVLTQASAVFALQHKAVLDEQAARIRADRTGMLQALGAMQGVQAYPSEANFILFKVPDGSANGIFDSLRRQGVLIKNLNPAGGRLADCLRVTVGKPEENQLFLAALQTALGE